ncbi:MAG: hypothetical protein AAF479_05850 [Pseudomonadota bacterium]
MQFDTVSAFVKARPALPGGVIAVLLCETRIHAQDSARRLAEQGAGAIIAIGSPVGLAEGLGELPVPVISIAERPTQRTAWTHVNALIDALGDRWLLWLWNSEWFVFPFGETRTLNDLTAFLADERRKMIFTYALDLYAAELPGGDADPRGAELCFDRIGYHAFPREEKVLRLFGGLGWRFAELTPRELQQIGRTSLFRAQRGTWLDRNYLFDDPEYGSVQCKWHHNPTAAVMTLRRARRIMAHPQIHELRGKLMWQGTQRFDWTSRQLLELGMIEPGQWF